MTGMQRILGALALGTFGLTIQTALAETQTESNRESRTTLSFKVPDAVAQALLPAGVLLTPAATGATKDSNIGVVLIERHFGTDPEGKPLGADGTSRALVLTVPGRTDPAATAGTTYVVTGVTSDAKSAPGAYGVYGPGTVEVDRQVKAPAGKPEQVQEVWTVVGANGERFELRLAFTRAVPVAVKFDTRVYSAADAKFYRMYRGERIDDIALSVGNNVNRTTQAEFKAAGGKLAALASGAQLIAVNFTPFYRRDVFLP